MFLRKLLPLFMHLREGRKCLRNVPARCHIPEKNLN